MIKKLIAGVTLTLACSLANAAGVNGAWTTEPGDDGGHLEVTIAACASDASKTCGTISKAYGKHGVDSAYKDLGKLMVMDMHKDDDSHYSGGTIWDPEKDKTYKSKMHLKGDVLDVEGCVSIFCQGQDWKRVK